MFHLHKFKTIYCSAPCVNEECFRHPSKIPSTHKDPKWQDYSKTCTRFEPDRELDAVWRAVRRTISV